MVNSGFLVREALKCRAALPFNFLPSPMISCAEEAIRVAWAALVSAQQAYGIDLTTEREDKISYKLIEVLNFLRAEESKPIHEFAEYFESVNVCSGCRDYEDKQIKQPDFALKPRNNPTPGIDTGYYAIFVEAKVIGHAGQQTSEYFIDGVERFLDGKYAWAMPQGLMLAYVRTEQVMFDVLNSYLDNERRKLKFNVKQLPVIAKPPNRVPKVCVTVHTRKWSYVDRSGSPGDIELRHLWLPVN